MLTQAKLRLPVGVSNGILICRVQTHITAELIAGARSRGPGSVHGRMRIP
jgi:hypothetical protein